MTPLQEYLHDLERRALALHASIPAKPRYKGFRPLASPLKPFIGVDGEGAGEDEEGRQKYTLFRMGERELYKHGDPLSIIDLLDFILETPPDVIPVGYYFDYDATQILRGAPRQFWNRLFRSPVPTFLMGYAIEYIPRNHLAVARIDRRTNTIAPGSRRYISDIGGFYQCRFVDALRTWKVGTPEQLAIVEAGKAKRDAVESIGRAERRYCAMECDLMAELSEKFRLACHAANIRPRSWEGAGTIARALMRRFHVTRSEDMPERPKEVDRWARLAYFGGRFEITAHGAIDREVWEYDINSAYPYQQTRLPCLRCGTWSKAVEFRQTEPRIDGATRWLARVKFAHQPGSSLCAFPFRQKRAVPLAWPLAGEGVYWDAEIEAAKRFGASVTLLEVWRYDCNCDHQPFDWIPEIYQERLALGKDGPGITLKFGLNALYGQTAQRVGRPAFSNMLYAGMITAGTRAMLLDAASRSPGDILMMATDSLYSLRPLETVAIGGDLGQWSAKRFADFHIVQPGLYWSPAEISAGKEAAKLKTRGIGKSLVKDRRAEFEEKWSSYQPGIDEIPSVDFTVRQFIGARLANARGKPELAGRWIDAPKTISYDWATKRQRRLMLIDGIWRSSPLAKGGSSADYNPSVIDEAELSRYETEAMPDYTQPEQLIFDGT